MTKKGDKEGLFPNLQRRSGFRQNDSILQG